MSERQSGVVKSFDDAKGEGSITLESGPDVYVHFRSITVMIQSLFAPPVTSQV
jgi:cold shock CspA family protein